MCSRANFSIGACDSIISISFASALAAVRTRADVGLPWFIIRIGLRLQQAADPGEESCSSARCGAGIPGYPEQQLTNVRRPKIIQGGEDLIHRFALLGHPGGGLHLETGPQAELAAVPHRYRDTVVLAGGGLGHLDRGAETLRDVDREDLGSAFVCQLIEGV